MKTTGTGITGTFIVEMCPAEHATLLELESVLADVLYVGDFPTSLRNSPDMDKAFIAVTEFVKARFMVQKIRELARELEHSLMSTSD